MASDHYGQYMGAMRSILTTSLEPLERLASLPKQMHGWYLESVTDQALMEKELLQLRTENLMLKASIQKLDSLEMEVSRLQRLLGTTGKMDMQSMRIASVVHYSTNPISQYLTINKGHIDGVKTNQPVIDAYGVLGQVINTTPTSSRVLLITDPDHQLPIRIQRTGQRGILSGLGNGMIHLEYIPNDSNVQIGDQLVTSGLGGLFPAGYPAAVITEITPVKGSNYLEIKAAPVAQIDSSYEVLILANQKTTYE